MFSSQIFAQSDTVNVSSDLLPAEGNLNNAINAAITKGTLSNTVFKLELCGRYILTSTITIPGGECLTIIAPEPGKTQATAPPQILWSSNEKVNKIFNFKCFGDMTLKNIWINYTKTSGDQVGSSIQISDDPGGLNQHYGNFEGIIFDYSKIPDSVYSGAVGVACKKFKGTFKNCYWRNCIDSHFRYYGRAVSFPYDTSGYHIDSLLFENCTFANLSIVFSQENNEYVDYLNFNHCTFLNIRKVPKEAWLKIKY
jgi:hypothetical protein